MTGTELDQRLVLHFDQLFGRIALGAIPERVDAQRLNIDARLVHVREAVPDIRPKQRGCFERVIDQLRGVGNDAVRVHIDGLDPLTGDDDLPASMRVRVHAPAQTGAGSGRNLAIDKSDAGGATGWRIGADRHFYFLPSSRPRIRREPTMAPSLLLVSLKEASPCGTIACVICSMRTSRRSARICCPLGPRWWS